MALRAPLGEFLPIPPLVEKGVFLVRDIRLEKDGATFLRASPDAATVEVIDRVRVTQVTTRPLTLEEIRQKGILFGDDSFTGFNFTLALKLDSRPVTIDFPVVFDSNEIPVPLPQSATLNLQAPGLPINTGIVPVMMTPNLPPDVETAVAAMLSDIKIPGLIIIPGDVGFLNQFFSALLLVSNGAPAGSGLAVEDLEATIVLPPGADALEEYFQEDAGIGTDPQLPWTFNKPVERIRDWISTNSGDIVVFANARDRFQFYEKPLEAQHGSLTYADSLVPIVFAYPGATGDANADDTLAPIKQFFQLLPKDNVGDGGQAIQAIAEADALRAFFGLAFDARPHGAN